jgi:hypothetical protein
MFFTHRGEVESSGLSHNVTSLRHGRVHMTAAQFELLAEPEAVEVLRWRFDVLLRVGFEVEQAAVLAANVEIDLHAAEELMRRGCPADTAMRILI